VSAECLRNVRECQDSIDVAVSILNDLLSYEKLESGIMTLYREVVPAASFIESTLAPFSLQVRELIICINISVEIDPSILYIYVCLFNFILVFVYTLSVSRLVRRKFPIRLSSPLILSPI
jgi:signal transduction histidine kinase